jgi:hypothetical protein
MKEKKVFKESMPPSDHPPLEIAIYPPKIATWANLKEQFSQCHDVMLGLWWYDANGQRIRDAAHRVTVANFEETADGKKWLRVANPWGKQTEDVNEDNREGVYDKLEVTVGADGRIRIDNDKLEKGVAEGSDHLCVQDIAVVRPEAPHRPALAQVPARSAASLLGGPNSYSYAYTNTGIGPVRFFAIILDVPYQTVVSPPGWSWSPLPANHPGVVDCNSMIGPAGILWTTTSNPISPTGTLSGFGFDCDPSYPSIPEGLIAYVEDDSSFGSYEIAAGPVPLSVAAVDEPEAFGIHELLVFPNPALADIEIQFQLQAAGEATLEIFDITGRRVRRIHDAALPAGRVHRVWDRRDEAGRVVTPGRYFCRLEADGRTTRRAFSVLR